MNLNINIVPYVLFLFLVFSVHTTLAATIRIPADQPTIQAGIDAAEDGDRVLVSPSTYFENIDFLGKAVTVLAVAGLKHTTIDGNVDGSVVTITGSGSDGAVLNGFTVRNGTGTFFEYDPYQWGYCGGGIFISDSNPSILNCWISENAVGEYGGGIYCDHASPTIANCIITENFVCQDIWTGAGICCRSYSSPRILNCTIADNQAPIWGAGIACLDRSFPIILNSILWCNDSGFGDWAEIGIDGGLPIIAYSDWRGAIPILHNIDADPLFIGPGNYHLRPGSPCIDTGTDAGVYTDIDGQSRPWGAGFDMGADEFSTEPCSVIASSGSQFLALYLIPALALILIRRRIQL